MFCKKLKLYFSIAFLLFFQSNLKCESLIWFDSNSNNKKQINLDNGEISVELNPRQFQKIGIVEFPEKFNKREIVNQKIQVFIDGKLNYFLIKDLNLIYMLDEEHSVFNRFDFNTIASEVYFYNTWDYFNIDASTVIIVLLTLIVLYFVVKWIFQISPYSKLPSRSPKYIDDFLQLFERNGADYICSTLTLNEIIHIEKKSYETQRQLRSKFIRSANKYLNEQYHLKNAIIRITSNEDRRFVNYQLSKMAFRKLFQSKVE